MAGSDEEWSGVVVAEGKPGESGKAEQAEEARLGGEGGQPGGTTGRDTVELRRDILAR